MLTRCYFDGSVPFYYALLIIHSSVGAVDLQFDDQCYRVLIDSGGSNRGGPMSFLVHDKGT